MAFVNLRHILHIVIEVAEVIVAAQFLEHINKYLKHKKMNESYSWRLELVKEVNVRFVWVD
jgi:hypothetical protein